MCHAVVAHFDRCHGIGEAQVCPSLEGFALRVPLLTAARHPGPLRAPPAPRMGTPDPYAESISLPRTPFAQRANAAVREPEIQAFWREARVYDRPPQPTPL